MFPSSDTTPIDRFRKLGSSTSLLISSTIIPARWRKSGKSPDSRAGYWVWCEFGYARNTIYSMLSGISTVLRWHPRFEKGNFGWIMSIAAEIPKEPESQRETRRDARKLDYRKLAEDPREGIGGIPRKLSATAGAQQRLRLPIFEPCGWADRSSCAAECLSAIVR